MACNLGPEILCSSINNIRIAEDAITAFIIAAIIYLLIDMGYHTIKQGPLLKRIIVFVLAFLPFFLWKLLGAFRRIFLDSASAWYEPLSEFGEVMEAVSALCIIIALFYLYIMMKPKKETA
ncbi:MAG: hypothetical protein OIN87_07970 [Candidatus Methanoperedens sp.]|nr:hypothetical protein [Candidatus Methanoperedens sp.]